MRRKTDIKKFDIQDRSEDTNYGPAEIEKQIAITFDLSKACNIEIWMHHGDSEPMFAEKIVTDSLRTGTTTVIHDVDDYLHKQYKCYVFVYDSATGNAITKGYDIPLEKLNGKILTIKL